MSRYTLLKGKVIGQNQPNNTIFFLETIHVETNLVDLPGDVAANDSGPLLDENPSVLHVAVEWVNGDGGVLHDDFSSAGFGYWGVADLEGGVGFVKPCGLVLGSGHDIVVCVCVCVCVSGLVCAGELGKAVEGDGVWNSRRRDVVLVWRRPSCLTDICIHAWTLGPVRLKRTGKLNKTSIIISFTNQQARVETYACHVPEFTSSPWHVPWNAI